jgi:lipopolysaccharide assembly outer membrane protein LptD (OstA)
VPKPEDKSAPEPAIPSVTLEKPEISHLVNGKVTWTVKADSFKSDAKTGITKLFNSRGLFLRGKDRKLEFTGPLTIYDTKDKSVRVEGGVRGKFVPEDRELTADGINWSEKSGIIVADNVNIKVGGANLTGARMELNPDSRKAAFSGGVRIEIPVPAGRKGK